MDSKEQNRIILDLIEYHWDLNTIKEWFGEIPQGVDYQKHILEVLKQIASEANMPLGEMSIDGDQVLIKKPNGDLPISNLSEGEKLDLCVDIALKNKTGLQIVLIDGVEKLSPVNRQHLYDRCKASGLQFIAKLNCLLSKCLRALNNQ